MARLANFYFHACHFPIQLQAHVALGGELALEGVEARAPAVEAADDGGVAEEALPAARRAELAVDEEVSIGDYVLSGGELPAMVLIEGMVRLLPGVLGNPESIETESFRGAALLEGPHYTRPPIYRGLEVPEVLRSGDHAAIETWRRQQAQDRTRVRRPDLLEGAGSSVSDRRPGRSSPPSGADARAADPDDSGE